VIAVYGATGYTGRLVAAELARRGLPARLCGRSGGKLRALRTSLGVDWDVRVAAIDDAAGLRRAFDGCSVVLSCAGPFTFYGAPVIEAALDVGAHYCDTTAEQLYMQGVFEHLGPVSSERGLAVVPAVGFDVVPGDLAAALAARGVARVDEVVVAYAMTGFAMTRGTMRSALEMLRGGELEYVDGGWRPAPRSVALAESFTFPAPVGEQPVVRFPGGEVVTVPRHVRTRAVRGRMTAESYAPHPALAGAVPYAMPALGVLLATPLSAVADAVIDRLPEGPSEADRVAGRWTVVAEAQGEGATGRCTISGSDPYGITAVIAVEFARILGSASFTGSGALAPAQVTEPDELLTFLADHGVTYEAPPPPKRRRAGKTPARS